MYDLFLQWPLLQGINKDKLQVLFEKIRCHFVKYPKYALIAKKGENCKNFKFLISGKIKTELTNNNEKIKVIEEFSAPNIIAPNFFFGSSTTYPYDVYAVEDTGIMEIDKPTFITLMQNDEIFLLNMLNITSNKSQKNLDTFSFFISGNMIEKLAFWL